nr:hypothetical chloroplast RF20 [Chloroidium sp. KL-2023a]
MTLKSKLYILVFRYIVSLRTKYLFLQKNFSGLLALLFFGFLLGNLFSTFLNTLRFFFIWDVFIIFILIVLLEILNYTVYRNKNRLLFFSPFLKYGSTKLVVQFLNFFKIGLMIGFFVDAFKVGS